MMLNERSMFTVASMAFVLFSFFVLDGEARWQGVVPTVIGDACSEDSVSLIQSPTKPLPNGIPTYTVQVLNLCLTGCSISNVRVRCGSFSTATAINPKVFRRKGNECIVNDGKPIPFGGSVSFMYADILPYTLTVASVVCDRP